MLCLELGGEMLLVRHDGGDLSALSRDLVLRLGESARVDAAIGAPISAMEGDGDRPLVEKPIEADEVACLVGQDEKRHGLAGLWRALADALLFQPRDKPIDGLLEMRAKAAYRVGESLQPLSQRRVHVAGLDVGLVQRVG